MARYHRLCQESIDVVNSLPGLRALCRHGTISTTKCSPANSRRQSRQRLGVESEDRRRQGRRSSPVKCHIRTQRQRRREGCAYARRHRCLHRLRSRHRCYRGPTGSESWRHHRGQSCLRKSLTMRLLILRQRREMSRIHTQRATRPVALRAVAVTW